MTRPLLRAATILAAGVLTACAASAPSPAPSAAPVGEGAAGPSASAIGDCTELSLARFAAEFAGDLDRANDLRRALNARCGASLDPLEPGELAPPPVEMGV